MPSKTEPTHVYGTAPRVAFIGWNTWDELIMEEYCMWWVQCQDMNIEEKRKVDQNQQIHVWDWHAGNDFQ